MKAKPPSKLELQVLSVLWEHGALSVREVLERIPDGKPRAYTTILSVLQVMEKKKLVTHGSEGNRHVYEAAVKKRAVVEPFLSGIVNTIFGGRSSAMMQHLLEASEVSDAEIKEIRALLDQHGKKRNGAAK
jgi:predicted transcriptional regulator